MAANAPSDQYLCDFILRPPSFFYIIHLFEEDANGNIHQHIFKMIF